MNTTDILSLISHFSGVTSWFGLAGLALFVMLILFRPVINQVLQNLQIAPELAQRIVLVFLVVVGLLVAYIITLAFLDGLRSIEKVKEVEVAREQCIAEETSKVEFTRPFSMPGNALCPGSGCGLLDDDNCNRRQVWLSYSAPGDYYLDQISVKKGRANYGSIGDYTITEKDSEGHALAVKVSLVCDPPDYIGAAGGWSHATLVGTERLRDSEGKHLEINSQCESKFPFPE